MTVSTGIGGGIILNGKVWHGLKDAAGEIGHMTVCPDGPLCGCGNRGCLEAMSSGTSIARRAREAVAAGRQSGLSQVASPDVRGCRSPRPRRGRRLPRGMGPAPCRYLGIGVAAVITILAPERVVIGGGVTRAGDFLFQPLREQVRQRVKLVPVESVPILPAALGPDVGHPGGRGGGHGRLKPVEGPPRTEQARGYQPSGLFSLRIGSCGERRASLPLWATQPQPRPSSCGTG